MSRPTRMIRRLAIIGSLLLATMAAPLRAQDAEPEHIRGVIVKVEGSTLVVKTNRGGTVRMSLADDLPVISLRRANFAEVDYGTYVGSVAVRLDEYSPIIRDSLSWLHKGFELRIIDDNLRGIALGHKRWDLTRDSIIAHGWVDDIEIRVLSIKYGPTEQEETDVEISEQAPVLRMSLGDRRLLEPGAHIVAGAQKGGDGKYTAVFLFVGVNGVVPAL